MTIGADICKYGAFSNKVSYTYSNKVWDAIFSIKTV